MKKMVLRWFSLLCLVFLTLGCSGGSSGGGEPAPVPQVAFLGDSLTNGGSYPGEKLAVSPVVRMTEYAQGRWTGVNYAVDGMRCVEHPVPQAGMRAYVFRFGMADQVKGTVLAELQDCLYKSVKSLLQMGNAVYLVGVIHVPDPSRNAILEDWDRAIRTIATSLGAPFIDVRSLGQVEMHDDIHPNQVGSDRVSRLIADSIR